MVGFYYYPLILCSMQTGRYFSDSVTSIRLAHHCVLSIFRW